jgi:D-proline reductase (dithiol) PrdB
MADDVKRESFEEFKRSFSYGTRSDLGFKFLSILPDHEAAKFFQDLLWKLGDSFDDGSLDRIVDHVYEWQVRAYAAPGKWEYAEGPFTPLRKPLAESRLALLTTSGHFVKGGDPQPFGTENMTQDEATDRIMDFIRSEPALSAIPVRTPAKELRVRHGGYDIRASQIDPNVVLPLEILLELESQGRIGKLTQDAYSFVGACSQKRLLNKTGPQWVKLFQEQQIDTVLLVPV